MNKIFINSQHFFGIVLIFLFTGCGPLLSPAASAVDVNSTSTQTAPTVEAQISLTVASNPTTTISPTASPWLVATGSPVPTTALQIVIFSG